MPDLIAIGYDDTTTALRALDAVELLAGDLKIKHDALAVIIRGDDGKFRTVTNQHAVGEGASWGLFWGFLFGVLFFVPVLGMVWGLGLGALMGKITKSVVDKEFEVKVRDQLKPGTSALFMMLDPAVTGPALDGVDGFGGTVLQTTLSPEAEAEIQAALHGP